MTGSGKCGAVSENGFTLIEVIIVAAIIGIIGAIAVPSYNSHQDKLAVRNIQKDIRGAALEIESTYNLTLQYPTLDDTEAFVSAYGAISNNGDFVFSVSSTTTGYTISAVGAEGTPYSDCTIGFSHSPSTNVIRSQSFDCEMIGGSSWI